MMCSATVAQPVTEHVLFVPTADKQHLEIGKSYYISALGDSVKIEVLKFYISNVQLFQKEELVFTLQKKHYLIDLANPESLAIKLEQNETMDLKFNQIRFNLGVDSLTNSSGAFGGDLDPTNGMYWTWQSGYINFKLEGISKACPARKNAFQFHLGGFLDEHNALQNIRLNIPKKAQRIELAIDRFLEQVNLKEQYQIMSPSTKTVELSKLVADLFTIK